MSVSSLRRAALQASTVLLTCAAFPIYCAAEQILPKSFQGLWVNRPEHDACSSVKSPFDATSAGEGVIALDGNLYFSQEERCNVVITSKACCDAEGEQTRGGVITCGKVKASVIFRVLEVASSNELIVATYFNGISGPSIKQFVRCK